MKCPKKHFLKIFNSNTIKNNFLNVNFWELFGKKCEGKISYNDRVKCKQMGNFVKCLNIKWNFNF